MNLKKISLIVLSETFLYKSSENTVHSDIYSQAVLKHFLKFPYMISIEIKSRNSQSLILLRFRIFHKFCLIFFWEMKEGVNKQE